MLNTFIFDLDGTLIDTLSDLTAAMNHALACFGFPKRSAEEVRSFIGNGILTLARRACPSGTDESVILAAREEFMSYYMSHIDVCSRPYDGAAELVKRLSAIGNTAVLTNKSQPAAELLIHKYFGKDIKVVGVVRESDRKPDPTLLLGLIDHFGASKENTVMIGDSGTDILTAKNAGVLSAAVTWGFRREDEIRTYSPDLIARSIPELEKMLTATH